MTKSKGFTIIELLIATTVFSTILLISTSGLIYIGKVYYRTVSQSKTQEAARSIISEVSQNVQFSGSRVTAGTDAYCIGSTMYARYLDRHVNGGNNQGLFRGGYSGACNASNLNAGATQLVPRGMFLRAFSINVDASIPDLATITVHVVQIPSTDSIGAGGVSSLFDGSFCRGGAGSEYCASSKLETTAFKRI